MKNTERQKAFFLDRDGVINKEVDLLHRWQDFRLLPGVVEAISRINRHGYLAIVITNQSVVARNLCTEESLAEIHGKMVALLAAKGARIDRIYYCPHHPDGGFQNENKKYIMECACRKPKTGLIELAAADFNIDLSLSFMVGDTDRDILCGRDAGCKTIAVRSGKGFDPGVSQPEFIFADLYEAVTHLLT